MSTYSELFLALTSGRKLTAEEAQRLIEVRDAAVTAACAERQRAHADDKYRIDPAESQAAQRTKRRLKGAALDAADLIHPEGSRQRHQEGQPFTPVPPTTAVTGNRPADQLAHELGRQPDVELMQITGPDSLIIHVRPQSLEGWHWWTSRLAVAGDSITAKGAYVTAKGQRSGVRVALVGLGIGYRQAAALRAIATPNPSSSPLRHVPQQRDGGHERSND